MFGINSIYIWVAVIILSIAVEAFTLDLSAIWFACGAVMALLAASIGWNVISQLIIFVLFSAALLILVRPFCHRFLKTTNEATNADRIIGETAVVTKLIDNLHETGEIKIFGQLWTARSTDNNTISAGEMVKIVSIQGVKAIVERMK